MGFSQLSSFLFLVQVEPRLTRLPHVFSYSYSYFHCRLILQSVIIAVPDLRYLPKVAYLSKVSTKYGVSSGTKSIDMTI